MARRLYWEHLPCNLHGMPWDFVLLLLILGVAVPWRSAVRMRQLMHSPTTTSERRLAIYAGTIVFQWLAAGVALWRALARGISPHSLGLALDNPLPTLGISAGLSAFLAATQLYGLRQLGGLPPREQGFAGVLARKLLPQNLVEVLAFIALVATVSVCEEFLYRGFVFAAIGRASGSVVAAALVSTAFFSLGHVYQGVKGLTSTFVLGLVFCALRIFTGSLAPCVTVHFCVDLVAGLAAPSLLGLGDPLRRGPQMSSASRPEAVERHDE